MNAVSREYVAMWACLVIGNLSTEVWISIVFIVSGMVLLIRDIHNEVTK